MTVICDHNFHPVVTGRRCPAKPCVLRVEDRMFVAAVARHRVWHYAV
jgi:hypothetical protein